MTRDTWQYQGRQRHGEWGHGTAPHADKQAPTKQNGGNRAADTRPLTRGPGHENPPAPAGIADRAAYAAYGVVGQLPFGDMAFYEARLQRGMLADLQKAMTAFRDTAHLDDEAYRAQVLDYILTLKETHELRCAGIVIHTARTLDDLAPAPTALANVVKSAGLPRAERGLDAAAKASPSAPAPPDRSSGLGLAAFFGGLNPISSAQAQEGPPEEENRGLLGEVFDPLASVRTVQFNNALGILRSIDPQNPQLTYVTGPNFVPSQEAVDAVNGAGREAATRRVLDFLMPGGNPIGIRGNGSDIRLAPGGLPAAQQAFDYLSVGSTPFSVTAHPRITL